MTHIRPSCTLSPMSKERWGEGNVYLRGKTYWIHYSAAGRTYRESCKTDNEAKARKFLRTRLNKIDRGEVIGPQLHRVMVSELLDRLVADYEQSGKSAAWARIVRGRLLLGFEFHKAARVGTQQIEEYITLRKSGAVKDGKPIAPVGNATINRELALLRHAFYLGSRTEPPMVSRVPKIPKLPEAGARQGFLDRSNLDSLVTQLSPEVGCIARFAFWTGCRKAEALGMRWDWVDLNASAVSLPASITKSGEGRVLPLVPELVEMLSTMKAERDEFWPRCGWVFSRAGVQVKDIYAGWKSAAERAGLSGVLLHDLRRSFVRGAVRSGVSERVAMAISGHKTRSVFERYNIVSGSDLKDAAKKLSQKVAQSGKIGIEPEG